MNNNYMLRDVYY